MITHNASSTVVLSREAAAPRGTLEQYMALERSFRPPGLLSYFTSLFDLYFLFSNPFSKILYFMRRTNRSASSRRWINQLALSVCSEFCWCSVRRAIPVVHRLSRPAARVAASASRCNSTAASHIRCLEHQRQRALLWQRPNFTCGCSCAE